MSDGEDQAVRIQRRRLKRRDERIKLSANFMNGAGIATLIVSLISPFMQGADLLTEGHALVGCALALIFHGIGQVILSVLSGE